jgi:hypothetical protein
VVPRGSGSKSCSYAGERTFALPRGRAEKFVEDYRTEPKVAGCSRV